MKIKRIALAIATVLATIFWAVLGASIVVGVLVGLYLYFDHFYEDCSDPSNYRNYKSYCHDRQEGVPFFQSDRQGY